ncbi:FADR230Wp [Eremothecium gossypii FDAG1]|nr:FADR230Wp [Eremothecium gossypii FDAG1]
MSEDIIDRSLELGIQCFQGEDYKGAAELFSKSLQLARSYTDRSLEGIREKVGLPKRCLHDPSRVYHPRYLVLLDNRAATWEKLNKLDRALADAAYMITVDAYNLKGYIRRGKVLQKLGRYEEALQVYENGLKQAGEAEKTHAIHAPQKFLDIVYRQRSTIKELLQSRARSSRSLTQQTVAKEPKLKRPATIDSLMPGKKRSSSKAKIDYIATLPVEIIERIMANMDTRSIIRCYSVCKLWKYRLERLPHLYQEFRLSCCYKNMLGYVNFVGALASRTAEYSCRSIQCVSGNVQEEEKSIILLLSRLMIGTRQLALMAKKCKAERIIQHICENKKLRNGVQRLSITAPVHFGHKLNLHELYTRTTSMTHLELVLNFHTPSEHVGGHLFPWQDHAVAETNLESFTLMARNYSVHHVNVIEQFEYSSVLFKRLKKLCITGIDFRLGDRNNLKWISDMPNLQELWLERNTGIEFHELITQIVQVGAPKTLRHLTFREPPNRHFDRMDQSQLGLGEEALREFFQSLESLDLMNTRFDPQLLLLLLQPACENRIARLNIGNCPRLSFARDLEILTLIFQRLPALTDLLLPNVMEYTRQGMEVLRKNIKGMKLKRLDLSFIPSLKGYELLDLLKELKGINPLGLETLTINGCTAVAPQTVDYITRNGYAQKVMCAYERTQWEHLGINSFWYR